MMLLAASLPVCVAGEKPRAMFGVVAEELLDKVVPAYRQVHETEYLPRVQ